MLTPTQVKHNNEHVVYKSIYQICQKYEYVFLCFAHMLIYALWGLLRHEISGRNNLL